MAFIQTLTRARGQFGFIGMSALVVIGSENFESCSGDQLYQITPDQQLYLFNFVGGLKRPCVSLVGFAIPGAEDGIFGFNDSRISEREALPAVETCDPAEGAECDQP